MSENDPLWSDDPMAKPPQLARNETPMSENMERIARITAKFKDAKGVSWSELYDLADHLFKANERLESSLAALKQMLEPK